MQQLRRCWYYILGEPFGWLFCYFFNTDKFFHTFEMRNSAIRLKLLSRLILPMFFVSYPLAVLLFNLYTLPHFNFSWINMFLVTVVGTLSGIAIGIAWDIMVNMPLGILSGMWFGMWLGMWSGISWVSWIGVLLTTIGGILLGTGIVQEVSKIVIKNREGSAQYLIDFNWWSRKWLEWRSRDELRNWIELTCEVIGIGVYYVIGGFTPYIERHRARSIGIAVGICVVLSIVLLMVAFVLTDVKPNVDVVWSIWWAITMGSLAGILAGITLSLVRGISVEVAVGMGSGIVIGVMLRQLILSDEIIIAIAWGVGMYVGTNIIGKKQKTNVLVFVIGISVGIIAAYLAGGLVVILFPICYCIGYCQLPLWIISAVSISRSKAIIQRNHSEALTYLRGSPLYWDEWTVLPLPGLSYMMELAIEQDIEQTLEIVAFVETERPHRILAVQEGARGSFLNVLAHELESKKTLRDISEIAQEISKLQSLEKIQNISGLTEVFALLNDVSLDATHYRNSLGWQARHDALQNMITNLKEITDAQLSKLIERWEGAAQHELDKLQQEPQKTDRINNPYVVGQSLQPGTSLFVGRQDLVQQLEQGLRLGSHRPTFFLNGERRMGKSSTIRQLPYFLDARHFLPIFFDLQAPEMTSSIAAFLSTIAEKIKETMDIAGVQVEPLENNLLQEARRKNEPEVYYIFNEWLKKVERVLEQNDRVVLLSFDEFENLETVSKGSYLDLHLLLNWFRSVIQNRPQLALLFSGGKSVSEMVGLETDTNWSGYFVNVQTFRVGFLREVEARQLITQPVPDYPIAQIFGDGVVDEIIHITGCHPFLVQAVCSNLVNNLNADSRDRAEIQDVSVAVSQVLEDWEDSYFQDLWKRTDNEQRKCLIAMSELGQGNLEQIVRQINVDKEVTRAMSQTVRQILQKLLKRDLVLFENEQYRIATPIFSQWVERNS